MTVSVLMVAEKPSICTSIATALSRGQMQSRGRTPPIHEFQGTFQGKPAQYRVTSVVGHIFSMDFPSAYQNWDATNPVDLFDAEVVSIPESKGGIIKHLEREAAGMDYLVLWLDCDREGENICFEVIRCTQKQMKRVHGQQIFRAKFSAVTAKDIEAAMRTLGAPNENESKAVEARQEMDLKIGVAFSRFQTKYFQGKYGDLDSSVISYGPCQTPTLGFCVDRHDEIKCFTPEPFWCLDVQVDIGGRNFPLEWKRKRLFDEDIANTLLSTLKSNESWCDLYVTAITRNESRKSRPTPMNTVTLLKLASSLLGIGPQAAMRAAEHLYLSGYLSYPRTESTAYPSSFDVRGTLAIVRSHPHLGDYANELLRDGYNHAKAGVDAGDHPPITPVGVPNLATLSSEEARVFDLVVKHFLASVSKDAKFLITKATFSSTPPSTSSSSSSSKMGQSEPLNCVEEFVIIGREEIEPGFTRVYGRQQQSSSQEYDDHRDEDGDDEYDEGVEQSLPSQLCVGMRCRINSGKLRKGLTTVPGYLTESELIGKMEKHGIGTDASISTHINNILVRNYVTLGPGRTLIPTGLGVVLVHGYYRIDPDLVQPDVRATIEKFCDMIAKGVATKEEVVSHSLRNFQNKFIYFSENIGAMDTLFEASFSPLAATGKFLSKCGKCLRYMRYIPLKPQRLYCPHCEETYSLPQNGTIKLYKEIRCPLDNFELVLFSLGNTATAQGKSYPLCPCCYNHPPSFEEFQKDENDDENENENDGEDENDENEEDKEEKVGELKKGGETVRKRVNTRALSKMGCNQCHHPTCKQSLEFTGICPCPSQMDANEDRNSNSKRGGRGGRGGGSGGGGSGSSGATVPCRGTLVLDINSKPNWKLACNECNTLVRFHANIHNLTPLTRQNCEECGTRLMHFEFNKSQKSPLPTGEESCTGCLVCSDVLNGLTEIIAGRSVHLTLLRQMRFKRGGRGRGGRGGRRGGGGGRGGGKSGDVKMSFADF